MMISDQNVYKYCLLSRDSASEAESESETDTARHNLVTDTAHNNLESPISEGKLL